MILFRVLTQRTPLFNDYRLLPVLNAHFCARPGSLLSKLTPKAAATLLDIYQPIIRGYFAIVAVYYFVMSVTHFWFGRSTEKFRRNTLSATLSFVSA